MTDNQEEFENLSDEEQRNIMNEEFWLGWNNNDQDDYDWADDNDQDDDPQDGVDYDEENDDNDQGDENDDDENWDDEGSDDWKWKQDPKNPKGKWTQKEKILKQQASEWKGKAEKAQQKYDDLQAKIESWEVDNNASTQQELVDLAVKNALAKHWIEQETQNEKNDFISNNPDVDLDQLEEFKQQHPTLSYEQANSLLNWKPIDQNVQNRKKYNKQSIGWWHSDNAPKSASQMNTWDLEKTLKSQFSKWKLSL